LDAGKRPVEETLFFDIFYRKISLEVRKIEKVSCIKHY
jgi:hypothetical protein